MIEILLASYNSEKYIGEQIESILGQTAQEWHLTIQDDQSSDRTAEIVRSYQAAYPEKISFCINEKNLGGSKYNFYDLLLKADADYAMTCDHDDVWLPDKVERTFAAMLDLEQQYGKNVPLLVHTDLKVADAELKVVAGSMFFQQNLDPGRKSLGELLVQNNVTGCTMMVNRSLLALLSPKIPPNLIMHDWWCGLVAAAFGAIGYVSEPTILYRQHGENQVGAKNVRSFGYNAKRMAKFQNARRVLMETYLQAGDFAGCFKDKLTPDQLEMTLAYADMGSYGKFRKIRTIQEYRLWKNGFTRRLGQFFFC